MNRSIKRVLLQASACVLVIFLISLLAKGPLPHDRRAQKARQTIEQLTQACDAFYEEYQALPLANVSSTDSERITTGKGHNIMPPLCSPNSGSESPKYPTFFEYQAADEKKDGLTRKSGYAELFDPWGNPYHVLFDYDYNETLKDPFTGKIIEDKKVLIWSLGPDGKSGTPETNADNIYSWNAK